MKTKTEIFLDKVKAKNHANHKDSNGNSLYSYEKANYVTSKTKLIITCLEHGDFEQTPNKHLSGQGCLKCGYIKNGENQKLSNVEFINKALAIHGSRYDYTKVVYKGATTKVIITCLEHGDFVQNPYVHLNSTVGCTKCALEASEGRLALTTEEFINKAKAIHKSKYIYTNTVYIKSSLKVIITCPEHGDFEQEANSHLKGTGCYKCNEIYTGYGKTAFKAKCIKNNNGLGILYVIRCFNESESFYKVGITSFSILKRFKSKFPYSYKVIHEIEFEPDYIYSTEKELLRLVDGCRYEPLKSFGGASECFSNIEPIQQWLETNLLIN